MVIHTGLLISKPVNQFYLLSNPMLFHKASATHRKTNFIACALQYIA